MPLLNWTGELRIGIGVFDKEHRGIVDSLNELQTAVEAGAEPGITTPLLDKLAAATRAHFAGEEAMMTSSKYPAAMLHALKHQYLLEQMNAFQARYEQGKLPMNNYSLNFLREWVATHIQSDDKNFGLWLNEFGKI